MGHFSLGATHVPWVRTMLMSYCLGECLENCLFLNAKIRNMLHTWNCFKKLVTLKALSALYMFWPDLVPFGAHPPMLPVRTVGFSAVFWAKEPLL